MKFRKSYKVELNPNKTQESLFKQYAGTARFVYNWGLDQKIKAYENKEKSPSAFDLGKKIVVEKHTNPDLKWLEEISSKPVQGALRNLDSSFKNFFRRFKQKSKSPGFPKWKSRNKTKMSFYLEGQIHVSEDRIILPRIGSIKLKQYNYLPIGKQKNCVVSEDGNRWFVSIGIEDEINFVNTSSEEVGVDLGIKDLATLSDGTKFTNPKSYKKYLKKLKKTQRTLSRKQPKSKNREKTRRKLKRIHYRIKCIRRDNIHKLTTFLTRSKSKVVIEDLNVKGMTKNHCLSQSISDAAFGEIRRQLEYKSDWYGCKLFVIDRFFPSSKMCSICGNKNDSLKLSDRVWTCSSCGTRHDRDINAAHNILAASMSERLNDCGETKTKMVSAKQ